MSILVSIGFELMLLDMIGKDLEEWDDEVRRVLLREKK